MMPIKLRFRGIWHEFPPRMPQLTTESDSTNDSSRPWLAGVAATVGAYLLYSLAAPLTKWLTVHGRDVGLGGGDAISFCNLLFLGNIAAAVAVSATVRPSVAWQKVRSLSRRGWLSLIAASVLAVAVPGALFFALQLTTVANVILISRAGPVFYAVAASITLGKPISRYQVIGYTFIGVAIILAMLLSSEAMLMSGDFLGLAAAFGAGMVSIVGRRALEEAGNQGFLVAKNLLAAGGFGAIALALFGPGHFADLLLPNLVVAVSIYGVLVVGLAQLLWNVAILNASPKLVGGLSFLSPLGGVLLTIFLLHEMPKPVQVWSLILVAIGMLIASRKPIERPKPPTEAALAAR